jgi:hypothetical protein
MGVCSSNAVDTRHRFSNARSRSIKRPGWNRTMVLMTQPISLRRISLSVLSNATSLTHTHLDRSPERQRRAHRIAMGGALRGTHGPHRHTTERCKCGTGIRQKGRNISFDENISIAMNVLSCAGRRCAAYAHSNRYYKIRTHQIRTYGTRAICPSLRKTRCIPVSSRGVDASQPGREAA